MIATLASVRWYLIVVSLIFMYLVLVVAYWDLLVTAWELLIVALGIQFPV